MAQSQIKGSGIISFDEDDFESATQVNYIEKDYDASDIELEPIVGSLQFDGSAVPSDVASGKQFYNTDLHKKETGTVQFEGNAIASDVEKGKTFYNTDLHEKKTGSLEFTGDAEASQVSSGKTFYSNNLHQRVTGNLKFDGDAGLPNVLSGQEFYNTSLTNKKTGNMANRGTQTKTLNSGDSAYSIESGYHTGSGYVKENSYKDQTSISSSGASAAQIWSGKTAHVNGSKITGTGTVANISNSWISGTSTNSLTITWNKINSGNFWSGVEISYADGTLIGYSGNTNSYTVSGLASSRSYTFRLRSYVIIDGTKVFSAFQTTSLSGKTDCSYSCCNKGCDGCGQCVSYCQTC